MAQPTWVTPAGNFGTYTEGVLISQSFTATPSSGSYTLQYILLNESLPNSTFNLNVSSGTLTGTPSEVNEQTEYSFTIRVYQYNGSVIAGFTDRTFSFDVMGTTAPSFITPSGALYTPYLEDSKWNPYQILISNPDPSTMYEVTLYSGSLPAGLEINSSGLIRGYATPPLDNLGNPTTTTNTFVLEVRSESGIATRSFSITVKNQVLIPGFTGRMPTIMNTRPPSYEISTSDVNYGFYLDSNGNIEIIVQDNYFIFKILGNSFSGDTLSYSYTGTLPLGLASNVNYNNTNVTIQVLTYNSGSGYSLGNQLKILGSDIGGVTPNNDIVFLVSSVGGLGELLEVNTISGLNVDSNTVYANLAIYTVTGTGSGAVATIKKINPSWINGTLATTTSLLSNYSFTFTAINNTTSLISDPITFNAKVVSQTDDVPFNTSVVWLTEENLDTIFNGEISDLSVKAKSLGGLSLTYSMVAGSLPPDLSMTADGEIIGRVSFETQGIVTPQGITNSYIFTVQALSSTYPSIVATKTFNLNVYQNFTEPFENLYMKALLPIADRNKLASLVQDVDIIPPEYIYRIDDPYFGKTTVTNGIVYQHMFGVPAALVSTYISDMNENFYWRNIILGPVKTAIAKNSSGEIVYEVVYCDIVDDLINENGVSINKSLLWPELINGSSTIVYPNSLPNMRRQISETIGQDTQSDILPLWMTGPQANGSSLGFIQAWVICYTKPGYSNIIKNNIVSNLPGEVTVINSSSVNNAFECNSTEGFYPNMKVKFTGTVFGGVIANASYYIHQVLSSTQFTVSTSPNSTYSITLSNAQGIMTLSHVIWQYTLNEIQFELDRFEIDKSFTFEWNPVTVSWTVLPSSTITTDDENQYVYFPQKNILN